MRLFMHLRDLLCILHLDWQEAVWQMCALKWHVFELQKQNSHYFLSEDVNFQLQNIQHQWNTKIIRISYWRLIFKAYFINQGRLKSFLSFDNKYSERMCATN
jgi:hypothetical protein